MLHGRKRATLALTAAASIIFVALVPASPTFADPEPDIDDVKVKVDRLYEQAEHAQERLNDAKLELTDVRKDLKALRQNEERQQARLEAVRGHVEDSIVDQYRGQSLSAASQIVVSDDPSVFLEKLTTMSEYNDMQSDMFSDYADELKALDIRKEETQARFTEALELKQDLKDEKAEVDKNFDEAQSLLDELEAEEREEMLEASRSGSTTRLPDVEPSAEPRPQSTTRWPRSETRMSTVPPARPRSTAPV